MVVVELKDTSLRSFIEVALKSVIPPLAEIVFPTIVIFVPAVKIDCFVTTKLLISFILLSIVFNLLCRFVILEIAISLYKALLAIDETSNISCSSTLIFKLISLILALRSDNPPLLATTPASHTASVEFHTRACPSVVVVELNDTSLRSFIVVFSKGYVFKLPILLTCNVGGINSLIY